MQKRLVSWARWWCVSRARSSSFTTVEGKNAPGAVMHSAEYWVRMLASTLAMARDTLPSRTYATIPPWRTAFAYWPVMNLNMPNLTSASGSWIVRFAELKQSDNKIAIVAPVAVSKVDPAYPADALRDNVEGTVTLYAVIHIDGTVSGIKVLNSVDPRLDEAAVKALSRWQFRPGMKAGDPVELEAVVMIPFRKHHPMR